ncbi:MAG: heavy metal translocating P-type ATPase [Burkholderiales bacterium]|nr:heavy metal translocating P-type ATPase [Burkholderiales bacterium]
MTETCFHCGEVNPPGAGFRFTFDGATRNFCCAGCQAVAETIIDAGMADFYRKRERPGVRPESLVPAELAQYDDPAAQSTLAVSRDRETSQADLLIDGMTCAACAWLAERTLKRAPGVRDVSVQYATGRASVTWDAQSTPLSALLTALRRVGLDARPADRAQDPALARRAARRELLEWLVAGLGMMQVMMYAVPVYMAEPGEITAEFHQLMRWASLVLTVPVIVYSARRFFANAWRDLRAGQIGMDVPVALALALTFVASTAATVTGEGHVYFDSITMFVFLLLGARFLESRARRRAARAMERLAPTLPPLVERLTAWPGSDQSERIPGTRLAVGDVIRIPAGGTVPADAVVLAGTGAIDESLLTGESRPVTRAPGTDLLGGSLNTGSPLIARVTRAGEASTLAQLARLARRALSARPPADALARGLAGGFSIAVLALAALTLFIWWPGDTAFENAVAVLVVTCPCALALAQPAAWATASGRLSQWGLLTVTPRALDALNGITDVVLDKTGTLTESRLTLEAVCAMGAASASECMALATRMEAGSTHPIAQALLRHAGDMSGEYSQSPLQLTHVPGQGVEALVKGERVRLGSESFVADLAGANPVASGADRAATPTTAASRTTRIHLGNAQGWLASFDFSTPLRADAAATVATLQRAGIEVHLLSGDDPRTAEHVASLANIRNARGGVLPDDKRAYMAALQAQGKRVLMVGDGCNDAPVLAQADAAIAMADGRDGADLARAQADLLLVSGRLTRIADALQLARATRGVMRQNLAWALAYNLCSVPLAMAGLIHPWVAALGMSASSLLVVFNAARLLQFTPRHEAPANAFGGASGGASEGATDGAPDAARGTSLAVTPAAGDD